MIPKEYIYNDHLESERLITRFLTPEDIPGWIEFVTDKEATRYFPDRGNLSPWELSETWMERQFTRYRENRYGLQALIDKQNNAVVGQCGLLIQEVDGIRETEVGYHIFPRYWGRGYAPEAARIFLTYAFDNNLTDSVVSLIEVRNINSQRVAEKNGLVREKRTTWATLDIYVYRIYKHDFMKSDPGY
jgi:[ribosomal protein S5]-alanine N-acetyltransferase